MTESRSPVGAGGRSRPRRAAAVLAAGVLGLGVPGALTGCGAGAHPGATLSVALREYRITPQSTHASAGAVRFAVVNDGRLTHSLVVTTVSGTQIAAGDPLAPGQTGSFTATLAAGHYLLTSGIQGDRALGLYGTLDVN